MALLLSSWSKSAKAVPQDYIIPPDRRPQLDVPICNEIPVIDLSLAMDSSADRAKLIQQLLKALDEYGVFQVINHGVEEKLMEEAMEVYKEFFNLPVEEKEKFVSDGMTDSTRTSLYSGGEDPNEMFHLWRDTLVHLSYPIEQTIDSWPDKPARYREVISKYAIGTKKTSQKIFELIAEGIGMEKGYFDGQLTENQNLRVNYYPKCPDPSLTAGLVVHYDPNILTLIQQNVPGLRIVKDGKWIAVQPLPNAFFVITGIQFQIISNGRFKAALHQVATNAVADRLSIGVFMSASEEVAIEPAKAFLLDGNPPTYKAYTFQRYMENFQRIFQEGRDLSESIEAALASFLVHN